MVENIYEVKTKVLDRIDKDIKERSMDGVNVEEMGKLIDMVKDLSEAEKNCWEADYYRSVTEAMDGGSGYGAMGYAPMMGYSNGRSSSSQGNSRSGWANQYGSGRSSRGYGMSGYSDHINALRMEMQNADPQERERMAQELRSIGMM